MTGTPGPDALAPEPPGTEAARGPSRRFVMATVLALLAVHAALATTSLRRIGITFDEPAHLVQGLAALTREDYRLPENHLPGRWSALPLLLSPPALPDGSEPWRSGDAHRTAQRIFWSDPAPGPRLIARARPMTVVVSIALALLVFGIARRLFGDLGGLLSLALYCLSPTVLAHARLVTADLPAAALLLAATWTTWLVLERVTLGRVAIGCAAVAALFTTKMSAAAILPVAAVLTIVQWARHGGLPVGTRPRPARGPRAGAVLLGLVIAHAASAIFLVWAIHDFRHGAIPDDAPDAVEARAAYERRWREAIDEDHALDRLADVARRARLFPEPWLFGWVYVSENVRRPAFLLGEWSRDGFRWFFPYVMSVKTPLPTLALLLLAALAALRPRGGPGGAAALARESARRARAGLSRTAPLWTLAGVYLGLAILARLSIGHRHVLPVYPALFVLAGAAAAWRGHPRRLARAAPWVLVALLAFDSLLAWPGYASYFNALHGGPRAAHRHVIDSSLDWGQGLPSLRRALDALGLPEPTVPLHLSYFGTDDPWVRGIDALELPSYHPWSWRHGRARGFPLRAGDYVFSASTFQGLGLEPLPPWTAETEEEYRAVSAAVDPILEPGALPEAGRRATSDPAWRRLYVRLDELRMLRLTAWLRRHRPAPDHVLTPAYLHWRLDEDDLAAALRGPPPLGS